MRGRAVVRRACLPARGIGLRPLIGSSHPFFSVAGWGQAGLVWGGRRLCGWSPWLVIEGVAVAGCLAGRTAGQAGGRSVCRVCRHLPGVVRVALHARIAIGRPTSVAGVGLFQVRAFALIPCGEGLRPPCASLAQGLRPFPGLPLIRPASRQVRALAARRFRCAPGTRGRVPSSWVLRLCR